MRSLGKTVSWRVVATGATTFLVYLMTGKTELAVAVGAWEALLKIFLYFIHERAWAHVGACPSRSLRPVGASRGEERAHGR
ncbi:MAG: DUF2061 domain-containing protein [Nannocystaceae bacterium]